MNVKMRIRNTSLPPLLRPPAVAITVAVDVAVTITAPAAVSFAATFS